MMFPPKKSPGSPCRPRSRLGLGRGRRGRHSGALRFFAGQLLLGGGLGNPIFVEKS